MNIKDFKNLSAVGASIRDGAAVIAVSLDTEWMPGLSVRGTIFMYESGEETGRWVISVDEAGVISQAADDFYRATELFDVMKISERSIATDESTEYL